MNNLKDIAKKCNEHVVAFTPPIINPLDLVRTPKGNLAVVSIVSPHVGENNVVYKISISFIGVKQYHQEHNSWWDENELEVIDSLPSILVKATDNHCCGAINSYEIDFHKAYNNEPN